MIDRSQALELLQKLTNAFGVSGFEEEVRSFLESFIAGLGFEVTVDRLGSLIAHLPGEGKKVVLVAHMDEIGMVVRHVDERGFVYLTPVGGVNTRVLPGSRLLVKTESRLLEGVVGEKPVHKMKEEERRKAPEFEDLFLDLGLAADRVKSLVKPGDPVSFKPSFSTTDDGFVVTKALDDRLGCLTLLLVASEVLKANLKVDLHLVFSAREEIGLEGARTAAFVVKPEIAVAVDVTHAGDTPVLSEREAPVKLGGGPVISRGAALDKTVSQALIAAGNKAGVDYQLEGEGARTGTDIDAVRLVGEGVKVGVVSLPLRYMHTPSEIGCMKDVEAAAKLLLCFLSEI
ncbi:MAG: M20/M25/M40 family metallo-hydrolase [Thermofilaceae archaeon]|nr:M20/M25/M40 family metallo-hydrolase [Thermofilaceae archaeon]